MNNLVFYSERGLLNSILLDMQIGTQDEQANKVADFLKGIDFYDGKNPFENIVVEEMKALIEPSFGQFGDPDLILSVKDKEGGNYVVFVEAKLSTYKNAAIDIVDGYPEFLGNTSKVNVQLALKHRFWKAYQRFNLKTDYVIQEDHVYDRQRKLEKDFVINRYIKEHLNHGAEVYFVALTNDDQATSKSNGNLCQTVMNGHFRPPIKEDYWKADKSRFGLLTYKML